MSMIIDGTNGLTFNNATTQASAGSVLQVVNSSYATEIQNNTSTYADTGLTATITPKFSTSKILVLVSQTGLAKLSSDTQIRIKLLKNSTDLMFLSIEDGANNSSANLWFGGTSACYLDSPSTTSSTTYKTQFMSTSNSAGVRVNVGNARATITLMEIAG
jgi:PIN domain nuclease of toxin-antitoxin system